VAIREETKQGARPGTQATEPIGISATRVAGYLIAGSLGLIAAHLAFTWNYLHGIHFPGAIQLYVLFDAAEEVTIPTWYASSLLLGAALLFAAIAVFAARERQPLTRHWYGLAAIFLGLSIDEAADAHGAISYRMSDALDVSGPLTYPWVIPGAIFTVAVALAYLSFLRQIDPLLRRRLLIAGALYVSGALGMEMVQATYDSMYANETFYALLVGIEEGMEMIAIAYLIGALLSHLAPMLRRLGLRIQPFEPR